MLQKITCMYVCIYSSLMFLHYNNVKQTRASKIKYTHVTITLTWLVQRFGQL